MPRNSISKLRAKTVASVLLVKTKPKTQHKRGHSAANTMTGTWRETPQLRPLDFHSSAASTKSKRPRSSHLIFGKCRYSEVSSDTKSPPLSRSSETETERRLVCGLTIFPLTGGCSEGLDALRFFSKHLPNTVRTTVSRRSNKNSNKSKEF